MSIAQARQLRGVQFDEPDLLQLAGHVQRRGLETGFGLELDQALGLLHAPRTGSPKEQKALPGAVPLHREHGTQRRSRSRPPASACVYWTLNCASYPTMAPAFLTGMSAVMKSASCSSDKPLNTKVNVAAGLRSPVAV
jgi:hypothetical protein